ncbi:MAG TPA: tRNA-dihydrouridine synthase [Candidatus Paceibacterota bacterium]|nr:tRNA-dihydrouridine synthase [Candidatus Paceibacterota bacterium]
MENNNNLWDGLPRPFFALAPMYDVTDAAFRQMFAKYSKEDVNKTVRSWTSRSSEVQLRTVPLVLFTEFVSADGLASEEGRSKLLCELYFVSAEQPIVAQIFGAKPETIKIAVKIIKDLGFAGVDINMGCPDRAVEKQGAGSALIKNPRLAQKIILAAKEVAGEMPVSVKTRIGYNKIDTENWARTILETRPSAVTFHLRTRKEMSKAEAHWEEAEILGRLGREYGIPIICNGDVTSVEEGQKLAEKYKIAGVMIGRGAFGKPWLFANLAQAKLGCQIERPPKPCAKADNQDISLDKRLHIMLEHAQLFERLYLPGPINDQLFAGHTKNFSVMRKHFKAYVSGFKGAMALRTRLMETQNSQEVEKIISDFLL